MSNTYQDEVDQDENERTSSIGHNKEELIESIVQETGLNSEEGRRIVQESVERTHLDEKYSNLKFKETSGVGPSLLESFLSSTTPSHGNANIESVHSTEEGVNVVFVVNRTENQFTRTYDLSSDSSTEDNFDDGDGFEFTNTTDTSNHQNREEFEELVRLAGADINRPSTLEGKTVPVRPSSSNNQKDYILHTIPKDNSIPIQLWYRFLRVLFNWNLISYDENADRHGISYTPNKKSWGLLSLFTFGSLFIPQPFVLTVTFTIGAMAIILLTIYHCMYLADSHCF